MNVQNQYICKRPLKIAIFMLEENTSRIIIQVCVFDIRKNVNVLGANLFSSAFLTCQCGITCHSGIHTLPTLLYTQSKHCADALWNGF